TVSRIPSFHYSSQHRWPPGSRTPFVVELHDSARRVVVCRTLHEDCRHCPPECWPKRVSAVLWLPPAARKLVLWEGKDKLYEEDIGDPPKISVECEYLQKEQAIDVRWT